MTLRVSTITNADDLRSLSRDWLGLLERAGTNVPFLSPEWLQTWWGAFRQDRWAIRDSLYVQQVRSDSGELVGLIPMFAADRPALGPPRMRLRVLSFLGADRYLTEHRAPLVDPSVAPEVGRAVAEHLLRDKSWDWISWNGLEQEAPFTQALANILPLRWGVCDTSNVLTLAPTWEQFRTGLKRNIKESLRHCYNSLKRDGLSASLVVAESPADVDKALDMFFRLHASRAGLSGTVDHPDRFEGARSKEFLREVCRRLADRGIARVFTLHIGGTPVAVRIGFRLPDCLYMYYSGYDPGWAQYGVMTTAVAEILQYAIREKIPRVHMSMGDDVSKSRWGPEKRTYHMALTLQPRWTSQVAHRLYTQERDHSPLGQVLGRILPKRRFD